MFLQMAVTNSAQWGATLKNRDNFMKRQRGRGRKPGGGNGGGGGGGGGGGNQGNRSLESNGPEVKIRGTAAQIYEKYSQYARDAQSSGDRVKYETYLQHAEHYFRIMAATMPREQRIAQQNEQAGLNNGDDRDGDDQQSNDTLKAVDAGNINDDDDGDDGDDGEGHDDEDVATSSGNDRGGNANEASADGHSADSQGADNQSADAQGGEGEGRSRRRRRRGRGPDSGPNDNGNNNPRPAGGGDTEARSALDLLARKQAAVAGS